MKSNLGISFVNFDKKYVQQYQQLFQNNPELLKETKTDHELTLQEVEEVQQMYEREENKFCFLIIENETNILIGDINLMQFGNMGKDEIEISIMIAHKQHRRKGYGQQALDYAQQYIKQKTQYKKIIAQIGYDNIPSQKFFEKNNFKKIKQIDDFQEYVYMKILNQFLEQFFAFRTFNND